jgi:hypothetical protein
MSALQRDPINGRMLPARAVRTRLVIRHRRAPSPVLALLRLYCLRGGKREYVYLTVDEHELEALLSGSSIVQGGRHFWV